MKKIRRVNNRKIARQIMKNQQGNNRIREAWAQSQIRKAPEKWMKKALSKIAVLRGKERQRVLDKVYRR